MLSKISKIPVKKLDIIIASKIKNFITSWWKIKFLNLGSSWKKDRI